MFSVSAAGGRPLNYQWRAAGAAIAGATQAHFTIPAANTNHAGSYTVLVMNSVAVVTSAVANLSLTLPPPPSPITNGLVVYLGFDSNLLAQAGTTNSGSLYVGGARLGPRYKPGVIGPAASFSNASTSGQPNDWAITLGNLEWIYSRSFSVSLWERTTTSGDGAIAGNKNWTSGANVGWVISSLDPKNVNWNAVSGTRRDVGLNPPFSDGNWHHVAVTFDREANRVRSFIDGVALSTSDISPSGTASFNAGFPTLISSGNGTYSGAADVDDFGMWTRAIASEEVAAIYHAGLIGQPLPAAVPGLVPTIGADPVPQTIATGGSASFSVQATGPGPLTYQWRFNGVNIVGATNSIFRLSSVTVAHQGIYTVLVRNASGGLLSAEASLSVYELAVTAQWDFLLSDLRATVGDDLEWIGDTASEVFFPLVEIAGSSVPAMQFGALSTRQGFYARHGAKPNGGGKFVNQYTLLMDVMYPIPSNGEWRALFQTDPFNHPENDADFYVGNSNVFPDPNGIGTANQFHGSLAPGQWYRLAFAVDLTAPDGRQLSKYVNGVKVADQVLPGGVDGRYALGPTVQLFTSGLAGAFTRPGYVSSIQFVNGCLGPEDIAALGSVSAAKLPAGNAALRITNATVKDSRLTLSWNGPEGLFQVQRAASLLDPDWTAVNGLVSNRSLTLPIAGSGAFYRVRQPRLDICVGPLPFGEQAIPSKQILRAAGRQLQFSGRPVDLARSPDGKTIFIKNLNNLLVIDAASWKLLQSLNYPGSGASMHGIAVSSDGMHVYVTGSGNELYDWRIGTNGAVTFSRTISLPAGSDPCGLTISRDGTTAYVCLGIKNSLAVVNLSTGGITKQIPTGTAPWDVVLSANGTTAYVSDWGGRKPISGDLTSSSGGTLVVVDERGIGASGTLSVINLTSGNAIAQVACGLHPSDLELSADGTTLFVANANSDTVTVIDTQTRAVQETILIRPDTAFPYGSAANGLAVGRDGKTLFVAAGGNNAVAVVELPNAQHTNSLVRGFIPTDWYPGSVLADAENLYLVNVKGMGTRLGQPATTSWSIGAALGTANKIPIPDEEALNKFTAQAFEQGRVPHIKAAYAAARESRPPVPIPGRKGEPSVFQHVVYILKENKTYDQVFGDLPQGNGDPNLCIYPRFVSPNHHALAEQYVLLDNFYCQGVNSADGHSWSTEGNVTDHLEKSFGGFVRSYTFGDDALTYSSSGFIWNNVLEHGLTFRNYGELDYASTAPASTWLQAYRDFTNGTRAVRFVQNIGIASLRPYSSTNVPGWNLDIPDVIRADGFIRELNAAQAKGAWESFHFLYLPNDHTGGPPSPRAQVADNDLALGRVVEAITRSSFASNTVIFVIEDDPQSGYDHVDGHRSLCLIISPYTRRGAVISTFYNQAGVLHSMERILGLPPMNQQDAMAPLMFDCFTNTPSFAPYAALPNNVNLAEGIAGTAKLSPVQRYWAKRARKLDLSKPDRIDDNVFNRFIWHSIKGAARYPSEFVGAHGRGLKKLGLVLDKSQPNRDDDD
jgi:YVTN family beta-propeller protein